MTGRATGSSLAGRPWEHYPVVVSTEAAAFEWASRRDAPDGAVLTADREVAPRGRLGEMWESPGVRLSIILRPAGLRPSEEGRLWIAAGWAVAVAIGSPVMCVWPDRVVLGAKDLARVKVTTRLRFEAIDVSVVTFRVACSRDRGGDLLKDLVGRFDDALAADVGDLAAAYGESLDIVDREVVVELLPRGVMEGTCRGVGPRGGLLLQLGSGRVVELDVHQVRRVR